MIFSDLDSICPNCGIGRLIDDHTNEERVCTRCGFALTTTEQPLTSDENKGRSQNLRPYRLGSDRKFVFSKKDYAGNTISSQVKGDLITASKYDREQREHEEAAVSHITELYDIVICLTYDDGLKKGDLAILRQRARNMVDATGQRQSELDLMRIIRKFVRVKLGKNPKLKEHFKLGLLHIKIRYQREQPQNISGRGNQIGKNRKEERIVYCNLCDTEIPNYKARKHHTENHLNVAYHRYIDKKNQYVRRSASLEDISIDGSVAKEKSRNKNKEKGQCTNCNVSDAIIRRYSHLEISKMDRTDIVSRLVARHKDKTGRWKACILQQRKIGER